MSFIEIWHSEFFVAECMKKLKTFLQNSLFKSLALTSKKLRKFFYIYLSVSKSRRVPALVQITRDILEGEIHLQPISLKKRQPVELVFISLLISPFPQQINLVCNFQNDLLFKVQSNTFRVVRWFLLNAINTNEPCNQRRK